MSEFKIGFPPVPEAPQQAKEEVHMETESEEKKEAKQKMVNALKVARVQAAKKLVEEFKISHEDFLLAVKEGVIDQIKGLRLMDLDDMFELLGEEHLETFLQSPEVQEASKEAVVKGLTEGQVESVMHIIVYCKIPTDVLHAEFFKTPAQEGAFRMLRKGTLTGMKKIAGAFNIPKEFFESIDAKNAAREGVIIIRSLGSKSEDMAEALEKEFGLLEPGV